MLLVCLFLRLLVCFFVVVVLALSMINISFLYLQLFLVPAGEKASSQSVKCIYIYINIFFFGLNLVIENLISLIKTRGSRFYIQLSNRYNDLMTYIAFRPDLNERESNIHTK